MATRTFAITKDVRLGHSGSFDGGAGDSTTLPVGVWGSYRFRALMQFSLDFSSMTSISAATLKIKTSSQNYVGFGSSPRVRAAQLGSSWSEGSGEALSGSNATIWPGPNLASGAAYSSESAITTSEGTWETVNVLNIVRAWAPTAAGGSGDANYGLRLFACDTDGAEETSSESRTTEFYSRESGSDPYIEVTYASNVAPGTAGITNPATDTTLVETPGSPVYATPPTGWPIVFSVADSAADINGYDLQVGTALDTNNLLSLAAATAGMSLAGGIRSVSTTYTGAALTRGATIFIRARFKDTGGLYGPWGYRKAIVNDAAFPVVASPLNGTVAQLDYQSGVKPRFVVGHTYSDPNGQAQKQFRWVVYADSGGTQIGAVYTSPWQTGTGTTFTIPYTIGDIYYWLAVEVEDILGLSRGVSTAVRTRARWASAAYHSGALTGLPTSWSVTPSNTEPPNTRVILEYGSSASATAPASYNTSLGVVGFNTFFHYRVWLLAWGSASPTSPSHDRLTLNYSTLTSTPDNWVMAPGVGAIDDSEYVYGTQSLKHTNTGSPAATYQVVPTTPTTKYVLSGRVKNTGAAGAELRIETADGTSVLASVAITPDAGWKRYSTPVWTSGDSVQLVRVSVYSSGPVGTFVWTDALKLEASTVVTPWSPSVLSAGAVVDAGGVQVDARPGAAGVFRLRGSTGGNRDRVELGQRGFLFGGDTEVLSPGPGRVARRTGTVIRDGFASAESRLFALSRWR